MKNNIPFWTFVKHYRLPVTVGYSAIGLVMLLASIFRGPDVTGFAVTSIFMFIFWAALYIGDYKKFKRTVGTSNLDSEDKKYGISN